MIHPSFNLIQIKQSTKDLQFLLAPTNGINHKAVQEAVQNIIDHAQAVSEWIKYQRG